MENWKPVLGYEGLYEVSDMGRVRRVGGYVNTGIKHVDMKWHKGRVLKCNMKRSGYLTVDLCKDNRVKTVSVHRLVAGAFLLQKEGQTQVNHINCNKADNRAVNLEWCTPEENRVHAKQNNLYHNPKKIPVRCKQTGDVFESSFKAAEWLNKTKFMYSKQVINMAGKIRSACLGVQKTAYGYTWEHANCI